MTAARRTCLDEQRTELAQLVELFAHPDRGVVPRAPAAAWALFDPSPCDDPAMLLARPILPSSRSSDQTEELSRAKALNDAGRYEDALAVAQPLLDQARTRNDRNFELAVLMTIGELRSELDTPDQSRPSITRLSSSPRRSAAISRPHPRTRARPPQRRRTAPVPARASLHRARTCQARAARRRRQPRYARPTARHRGQVFADENRLGEAERAMRQAIATLEQAYGAEHPSLGAALGTLSQILRAQHKEAEALASPTARSRYSRSRSATIILRSPAPR